MDLSRFSGTNITFVDTLKLKNVPKLFHPDIEHNFTEFELEFELESGSESECHWIQKDESMIHCAKQVLFRKVEGLKTELVVLDKDGSIFSKILSPENYPDLFKIPGEEVIPITEDPESEELEEDDDEDLFGGLFEDDTSSIPPPPPLPGSIIVEKGSEHKTEKHKTKKHKTRKNGSIKIPENLFNEFQPKQQNSKYTKIVKTNSYLIGLTTENKLKFFNPDWTEYELSHEKYLPDSTTELLSLNFISVFSGNNFVVVQTDDFVVYRVVLLKWRILGGKPGFGSKKVIFGFKRVVLGHFWSFLARFRLFFFCQKTSFQTTISITFL